MASLPAGSDFSFDNRKNFLYDSAPESPRGFNNYFYSATTSPNHQNSFSFIPDQHLKYDHQHGFDKKYDDNKPFAFTPGNDLNSILVSSADELFDGGKIKSCEPKHKKIIPSRMSFGRSNKICSEQFPIREDNVKDASSSSNSSFGWLYKKWKLKDLLFRNASEGHETNNKYDALRKIKNTDLKNSSSSTNSVSSRNKKNKDRAILSAHERHYKVNRAAAEEMKKRTYLPYKQNLMIGCMNLDAASISDPSKATLKIR